MVMSFLYCYWVWAYRNGAPPIPMIHKTFVTIKFMVGLYGQGPIACQPLTPASVCQMWTSVSWARTAARRVPRATTPRAPSTARHGSAVWRAFCRTLRATVWVSG